MKIKHFFFFAAMMLSSIGAFAQFSGTGSGTQSDPYRIFNADQLTQMRNFLNQEGVYFKLQNDINLTDWLADNYPSQGWQPVGSTAEPFKGVLDGNNKTISGFSVNRSSTDYVGLFSYVTGATIKDLTLKGDIKGKAYVGSLLGYGSATITNYTFEGTVTGTGNYVGGVGGSQSTTSSIINVNATVNGAGYTGGIYGKGADLTSATFTGQVTGSSYTGGLEGEGTGTFSSCTVNAPVKGTWQYTGGLVGYTASSLTVSDCKHEGKVEGASYTGGLVGYTKSNITASNGTHRNDVTGTTQTGGIIGGTEGGAVTLTSCFTEGDIIGTTSVGGICGQIKNPGSSSISGCNYWGNINGTSQLGGVVGAILTTNTIDFDATKTAGYKYLSSSSSSSYSKTACFYNTSSPTITYNTYGGYVSSSSIAKDINEWGISSHTVYTSSSNTYTYSAIYKVHNNIRASSASSSINLNITNCSAVGNINGTSTHIGGIIGQDIAGNSAYYTVAESKTVYYFEGNGVNTSTTSLTLRKYNYSYTTTNISESYFSGNLTGTNYIGGIAGTKQNGYINKCYASASINGGQYIGGIAGALSKESFDTNENSLNANVSLCPSITGTSNVGRIYGSTDGNFSVAALGTTSENRSMASTQVVVNGVTHTITDNLPNGTAVGISQLRYKANYVAWGWDFNNNNWTIQDTESFPYKSWQSAPPTFSGKLTSGATTISGKSIDGGTVYLTTSSGKTYSATCSGTTWSVTVDALHAGETVTAYAAAANKEKSYFTTATAGFLGSGTEEDPYQIASAEDLQGMYMGGYYKVMNDINLTAWIGKYSPSKGWLPVGYDGAAVYVDGGGHTITGLWTNSTGTYTGLFSKLKDGYIKNLNVEVASGKKVKGGEYTGILIAYATWFELSNCSVKGNAEGTKYVGGIIAGYFSGNSSSPNLVDLTYEGSLASSTASAYIGGITGYATCTMSRASSDVQITATGNNSYIGGITGYYATGGTMSRASSDVQITATGNNSYIGGIAGETNSTTSQCTAQIDIKSSGTGCYIGGLFGLTSNKMVTESYSNGVIQVRGSGSYTGGIAGLSSSSISDSYSTATISGTQYTAGLVGKATAGSQINSCYATGNLTGVYYGAGIVGSLIGTNTKAKNCVALNNQLTFTDQSSWASRVIGAYDEAAGDPDGSNLALATMQVSLNGVPVKKYDDLVEGVAKSEAELKQQATYETMGWDFDNVWAMPADGYPVLKWQTEASEPEVMKGDLTGDGKVSITDIVMIVDVIAGDITDANQVAAADVNGDGKVSITDCSAAVDLIAAGTSTPSSAREKANAMLSDTDFISGTLHDGLLCIDLEAEHRFTAFQMTVSVPEGMTLGNGSMNAQRGADHLLTVRNLGGGRYLVAGFSADNEELTAGSGCLLTLATEGQADADIVISDIEFATTQAEAYYLADAAVSSTPTGLNSIVNDEMVNGKWFDLQGRRVTKATKGIYIYNGKKTVIK